MSTSDSPASRENQYVLALVQALLGNISPGVRGVSLELTGNEVTVHFAVVARTAEVEDDIAEIVADIEGLMWPQTPEVASAVFEGSANDDWPGRRKRLVYLAR